MNECHLSLRLQDARIPLLLVDVLVVYGLHRWEARLKKQKADLAEKEAKEKEVLRRTARDEKAAQRNQTKAMQKKQQNKTSKQANFAMKHPIQQPDKSKKSR